MMKKWKIVLCIALAAVVLGGSLTVWLLTRTPPDTDPNAPFEDLPRRTKDKILEAVREYWENSGGDAKFEPLCWYGELDPNQTTPLSYKNYNYGLQYYGTFNGYHIICHQWETVALVSPTPEKMAGYVFKSNEHYRLFAYKDGVLMPLICVYLDGQLSDEQVGMIHQCWKRYRQEVYIYRSPWEEE